MKKITIAIDGFSSCGKSTMAKDLAKAVGYIYIDSGAMYRAVTLYCLQNNLFDENNKLDTKRLDEAIDGLEISFKLNSAGLPDTYLNGVNVETEIRKMAVSAKVSTVSAVSSVRRAMVHQQQQMGKTKGIVMDGRDVGTVVFPNAELKIFVTASPQIRAQRRLDELRSKGDTGTTLKEVLENLKDRDHKDQTRAEGPLLKAADALELDNSDLTVEQQMQWLLDKFNEVTGNEK
ncbi:cytidylate kinase [Dysgonomonas sp. PH5-45]|uniref:(d)CMP kinase n=1 Tax=unclassified Dysgonomonas TaxID=2630389 RepID=UPI002473340E|nr:MULTISPECIES: (d)CMP kinase [unclassified Dysgonomonas]MDH6355640.1 cytidylate kinase [Dysgonomonas sp. PH5-45]MDH6388537.1 cytidylate kinase [Dysgonomonas sp. PH5-37]